MSLTDDQITKAKLILSRASDIHRHCIHSALEEAEHIMSRKK